MFVEERSLTEGLDHLRGVGCVVLRLFSDKLSLFPIISIVPLRRAVDTLLPHTFFLHHASIVSRRPVKRFLSILSSIVKIGISHCVVIHGTSIVRVVCCHELGVKLQCVPLIP